MDKIEPAHLKALAEFAKYDETSKHPKLRRQSVLGMWAQDNAAALSTLHDAVSALLSENARLRELTGGKNNALDQLVRVAAENARLREALDAANYHLTSIGAPFNKRGEYDKHGEWDFSDAVPEPVNAREVKAAFEIIRAALSAQEDA